MNSKALKTVQKYGMISKGDTVYAAVSGGADSTALLLILNDLKDTLGFTLKAVHINHLLRGEEADGDERFVAELCFKIGVELEIFREDVANYAKQHKIGTEQAGRQVRYSIFDTLDGKIATAHTLDDSAETLIFNIARGCGINGVGSIAPVRDRIIRPLIECERKDIEQYLKSKNQDFRTDSTNETDDYTRNRIRHNIIPLLKEINPSFLKSAGRLGEVARQTQSHIEKECKNLPNDAKTLAAMSDALLCEYVRYHSQKLGQTPDFKHTLSGVDIIRNGGKAELCNGFYIENDCGYVGFYKDKPTEFCVDFRLGQVKTPHCDCIFEKADGKFVNNSAKINNLLFNCCFDCDKINERIILRNRLPSDKTVYGNMRKKSVKKLQSELKIPSFERNRAVVLATVGGDVIWISGIGVNREYAADENTVNAVRITVCDTE